MTSNILGKDQLDSERGNSLPLHGLLFPISSERSYNGRKEMFYLTTHSTHFIYGYMASDIWLRIILIVRKETRCRHIGYSFRLTATVLLYAPSHRQDSTCHGLFFYELAQWVHPTLTTDIHLAPLGIACVCVCVITVCLYVHVYIQYFSVRRVLNCLICLFQPSARSTPTTLCVCSAARSTCAV